MRHSMWKSGHGARTWALLEARLWTMFMLGLMLGLAISGSRPVAPGPPVPPLATNTNPVLTLWLYGGQAVTQDTFISNQNPTFNYGSAPEGIRMGFSTTDGVCGSSFGCWMLTQLNLSGIPPGVTIISADLFYYAYNFAGTVADAYTPARITASWSSGTVTWNTKPTATAYTDYYADVTPSMLGTYVDFSITSNIQAWYSGSLANHGIEIQWNNGGAEAEFIPVRATYADLRPKLEIVYQAPTATVSPFYFCSGGPCELGVFSGSGLAPWLWTAYMSENGNSTVQYPTGNAAVPSTGLKLAYNMDTLNGSKMKDFSGQVVPNDGTITGTAIVAGKYGNARSFNGASDYISVSSPADLPLGSSSRTLTAWVNLVAYGAGETFAISYGPGSVTGNSFGLGVDNSGHALADYFGGAAISSLVVPLNSWHFIAVTYPGGGTAARFYMDSQTAVANFPGIPNTASSSLRIGAWAGPSLFLKGSIDQPEIYAAYFDPTLSSTLIDLASAAPYQRVNPAGFNSNLTTPVTFVVKDFFANELYNTTQSVTGNPFFWNVGIPYRLFKVENMLDSIVTLSVFPSGGTPMTMDLLPKEIWSAPLKSAISYTFNFYEKDLNNNIIGTISLQRTMNNAITYIVNGTSLSELITDINGLTTTIQHNQFTAPVGLVGNNLPFVPLVRINPSVIPQVLLSNYPVEAFRYSAKKNGTGSPIGLWRPYDKTFQSAQVQVSSDQIWFSGTWSTIYLNDTKDTATTTDDTIICQFSTPFGTLTQCPSGVNLAGQNISVVTLGGSNVRADRTSIVTVFQNFNWSFNAAADSYQTQATVSDTSPLPWTDISAYFAFPAGVTPDPSSVAIIDLDNSNIPLQPGSQFSSDYKGIYMGLTSLGANRARHFQISFNAQITTSFSVLSVVANSAVPDSTFPPAAWKAIVTYAQPQGSTFQGDVVVRFAIQDPSFQNRIVDVSTLTVVDGSTGQRILNWYPHPTQSNVIVIPSVTLKPGTIQTYNLYFSYTSGSAQNFLGLGSQQWSIVALVLLIFMVIFAVVAASRRNRMIRKELR